MKTTENNNNYAVFTMAVLAVLLFLFSACNPQKRIARIAEKYNLKQWETVVYKDTIFIEQKTYTFDTQIDTAGNFHKKTDKYEVKGSIKDSTVYVLFTTKPDTIYIEKPINIETIKVEKIEKKTNGFVSKISTFLLLIGFVFVSYKYLTKK